MRKTKGKTKPKTKTRMRMRMRGTTKTKAKTRPKSHVKRRRNPRGDRPLSFDRAARDGMTEQIGAAPKHRVHDSINLVLAECDKVDAALIEITQNHEIPPLTIKEVETADDGGTVKRGWAVVSADPQKPLTERQAKDIVAAMRPSRMPAPIRIAAE
jgi:hypothetical protein